MAKDRQTTKPPYDIEKPVSPDIDNRELLELSVKQLAEMGEFMASKADIAALETNVMEKIHAELKPFHELRGEFKTLKRFFYIGLSAVLLLLCKMAFAPTLFTYTGKG